MADDVTTADLAALIGRDLTTAEETMATMIIELAEGQIETYLDRPIRPTSFTENVIPDVDGAVYLSNTPVISVEVLTVEEVSKNVDFFTVTKYGLDNIWELYWDAAPVDYTHVPLGYVYDGFMTVEYTAGLDYPPGIRALVMLGALKALNKFISDNIKTAAGVSGDVREMQVEDYRIVYQTSHSDSSGRSSLEVFNPATDFNSIKYLKRIRTG